MDCKDCIHYGVCIDCFCYECGSYNCDECGVYAFNDGKIIDLIQCDDFKDKSRYVDQPCKIGDTVYILKADRIAPVTIKSIKYDEEFNAFIYTYHEPFIMPDKRFYEWDIGRNVFLNQAEAEMELKEMQ